MKLTNKTKNRFYFGYLTGMAVISCILFLGCTEDNIQEGNETGEIPELCGNNVIDLNEVCDGIHLNGKDCVSYSFENGQLGCLEDCRGYDMSSCIFPEPEPLTEEDDCNSETGNPAQG